MGVPPMGAGERTRMSEGRRVGGIRTKQKAFDDQPSGPLVPRTGWSGAFDRFRNLTTSSPARFAVAVFAALILVFTGLLSLPAATTSGKVGPARRRRLHRGLDDLRHGPVHRRHRDLLLAVRQVRHLARREHRRHGRPDARVDPRSRDLQAPRAAREAHRRERHQSAAGPRRTGERGPDRPPRRGRPAAADRRHVDAPHRGGRRGRPLPRAHPRRHRAPRRDLGGPVLRGDGLHQHRLHAQPRWTRALRGRLHPADDPHGRGLPRQHRLPRDLHALEAPVARPPLVAAREADPHHDRRPVRRRRDRLPGAGVRQPRDVRQAWTRATPRSRPSSSRR